MKSAPAGTMAAPDGASDADAASQTPRLAASIEDKVCKACFDETTRSGGENEVGGISLALRPLGKEAELGDVRSPERKKGLTRMAPAPDGLQPLTRQGVGQFRGDV